MHINDSPYARVIGQWHPALQLPDKLSYLHYLYDEELQQFKAYVKGLLPFPVALMGGEIRTPHCHCGSDNVTYSWHHDCGESSPYMLVWSSIHPTEIRHGDDGEVLTGVEPYDIVLLHNFACQHRSPQQLKLANAQRWFARTYIKKQDDKLDQFLKEKAK